MSERVLVSPEAALALSFPELAQNIRANLEQAKGNVTHCPSPDVLQKLLMILENKLHSDLSRIPARPEVPAAPIEPVLRELPAVRNPGTRDCEQCRVDFAEQIGKLERQIPRHTTQGRGS